MYGPEIVAGIEACGALVIMCSAGALASPNVRQEIALAWKYHKPYLPLLLDAVAIPRDVEYWLEGAQWIEVLEQPPDVWLPAVLHAISRHAPEALAPTPAPTAPPPVAAVPHAAPVAPAAPLRGPLIGREPEVAVLHALLDFAQLGHGQVVFLVGEPGIGKTRLASELVAQAGTRGARACWSYCYEWEGAPPYWPWIELLRAALAPLDAGALRGALGSGAADIAHILPELRQRLPDLPVLPPLEVEHARFRLFDGIAATLRELARQQPLLLVLDDLHWADAPSLALLQFVGRAIRSAPVLLLGTYRTVEVSPAHPLAGVAADLLREPHCQRLLLRGFGAESVAQYVETLAGQAPSEATVDAITRETNGNPFFVGEITRLLLAEEQIGAPLAQLRVPESVREVVLRQVARLSDGCQALLRVASVVGRDFSLPVLEAVGRLRTDDALDLLDEALGAQLIEDASAFGQYRFSHALVQETLYASQSTARRLRLHRQVGEALEARYGRDLVGHADELAYHFAQAAATGVLDKAVRYSVVAAERAEGQFAWEAAIGQYSRALELLEAGEADDDVQRFDLLMAMGTAELRSGHTADGLATFRHAAEVARGLGDAERFARATLGVLGDAVVGWTFYHPDAVALMDEALALLAPEDSRMRAQVTGRLGEYLARRVPDRYAEGIELTSVAERMARRVGDDQTLFRVLCYRLWSLLGPDHEDAQRNLIQELIEVVDRLGIPSYAMDARCNEADYRFQHGDRAFHDRYVNEWEPVMRQSGLEDWQHSNLLSWRAMEALLDGRYQDAEAWIAELDRTTGERNPAQPFQFRVQLLREQDRLSELAIPDLPQDTPTKGRFNMWTLALVHGELGQVDVAARLFEELAANFSTSVRNMFWPVNMAGSSEVCLLLRDSSRAAVLLELLRPYTHLNISTDNWQICYGPVAFYTARLAALLERWDEAEAHFGQALAMCEQIQSPTYLAHTRYALAEMLLRRGRSEDRERAQALLAQALATANKLGMARLRRLALARLSSA